MKTTRLFGPGFLALLVAAAPACTVVVDDSPDDEADSGEDETTTTEDDESDASSLVTADDSEDSDGEDAGTSEDETTSSEITLTGTDEDGGAVAADAGAGDSGASDDLRLGCGEAEITDDAIVVTNAITESTTWSGVVVIESGVDVNDGADLTILPGTHIIMGNDADLELGWNSGALTVDAQGTESDPIIVCGKRAERGYWNNIRIGTNVLSESVLSNVRIFDGGGDSDAALLLEASVVIDQVLVSGSESAGVWASDFEEASSGLFVTDSAQAVILNEAAAVTHFPLGGELTDNDEALARLRFTTTTVETVFFDLGIPYLQERALDVNDGASISFEPAVEYQFAADADLEVGWNSGDVTITVGGTEDAPVVFRGETEEAGFWGGVYIRNNVRTDSKLSYLQIRNAGGEENYALELESAIEIDHVELIDNELGARIYEEGLDESSTALSIAGTQDYPLTVDPEAIISIPTGGAFTGNESDEIRVVQGNFTGKGTVPNLGVPYRIEGTFQTDDESELTIAAGTEFVMAADAEFLFGWNSGSVQVTAVGTEAEPIRIYGAVDEPGSWGSIEFGNNVVSASEFKYVELQHGGGEGVVMTIRTPVQVENCTFSDYAGVGILKLETDLTDYEGNNTFDGEITVELL